MTSLKSKSLTLEEFEALPNGTIFRANGFHTIMSDIQRENAQTVHDDAYGYITVFMSAEELAAQPLLHSCEELEKGTYLLCMIGEDGVSYDDCFTHYLAANESWERTDGFRAVKM